MCARLNSQAILDCASDAILCVDPNGLITYFNRAASLLLGYAAEELVGVATPLLFHDPHEIAAREAERVFRYGDAAHGFGVFVAPLAFQEYVEDEWTYIRKDGTRIIIHLRINRIVNEQGMLQGFMGIAREMNLLKNTQNSLQESDALFRDIFERSPYPMSISNYAENRILEVNQAYLRLTGLSRSDLIGQRNDKYDWFAVPDEKKHLWQLLQTQGYVQDFNHCARMLDGRLRTHLLNIYPIRYHGASCMASVVNDITEKVQAEEKLRRLTAELENKVRHRTYELEKSLRELANSQEQLIQSERLAALGQLAAGVAHELNTPMGIIHSSAHESYDLLSKDLIPLTQHLAELSTSDRASSFALVRNSSASLPGSTGIGNRQKRKELIQCLGQMEIIPGEAMADMLLDLGQETIVQDPPPWFKEAAAFSIIECAHTVTTLRRLSQIQTEASTKAARVLDALRSYLRQDDSSEKSIVNLHEEISMVLMLFHNRIKHGIAVHFEIAESLQVLAKRDQLNQVWINIVNNALQAMPQEGVLEIRAHTQEPRRVLIEFTDSGHGIPAAIQDRIFEPFFTTKKKGEGIGLGLDICRHIIENNQGTISVSSHPGHTMFTIELPLYTQEAS